MQKDNPRDWVRKHRNGVRKITENPRQGVDRCQKKAKWLLWERIYTGDDWNLKQVCQVIHYDYNSGENDLWWWTGEGTRGAGVKKTRIDILDMSLYLNTIDSVVPFINLETFLKMPCIVSLFCVIDLLFLISFSACFDLACSHFTHVYFIYFLKPYKAANTSGQEGKSISYWYM